MKSTPAFFIILLYFLFIPTAGWAAFKIHKEYDSKPLQKLNGPLGERLTVEKAWVDDVVPGGIERIQMRNSNNRIVAFTPARVTAIPFCFGRNSCWVFMWKTVYPFPAIFKFIPEQETWSTVARPPLQYSRLRYPGEGFEEKFNLLFGAVGIYLLFLENAWYFCCCIFFTIAMCLQITNYRDLPETQQKWIKRTLGIIAGIWHIPFPVEPYLITSVLLAAFGVWGMLWLGVPFVITMVIIFCTFFICCMRLAREKLKKNPVASKQ